MEARGRASINKPTQPGLEAGKEESIDIRQTAGWNGRGCEGRGEEVGFALMNDNQMALIQYRRRVWIM